MIQEIKVKCPHCLIVIRRILYSKEVRCEKAKKECYGCGGAFWYYPASGRIEKIEEMP